jgi:hypothetical protein
MYHHTWPAPSDRSNGLHLIPWKKYLRVQGSNVQVVRRELTGRRGHRE